MSSRGSSHEGGLEGARKVIIGIIAFFGFVILGASILLYILVFGGSAQNVTVGILVPQEVVRGVPFEVGINVGNEQDVILNDATIRIELPKGVIFLGVVTNQGNAILENIGDVGAGSIAKRTYKMIAIDPTGTKEVIKASVEYVAGRQSRFSVDDKKEITVTKEPIAVEVKMPEQVLRGSQFELSVSYKNISSFDFPEVTLKAVYPESFQYESASFPPDQTNSYWKLGMIRAGSTGNIKIKGTYGGSGDTPLQVPIIMNAQFLGNDYEIAQSSSTVALSPSPVTLAIRINNQENYVARAGDSLTLTVHYENKSGVALSNVVLNTTLAGEMIDFTSLVSNARIEPMSHTLTWDSSNMPMFALLDAGASGDVSATLRLKNLFPLKRIGDKNYVVKATATLTSPTVPYYITAAQTMSAAKSETKISGLIALESKLFFRDTNADVINFGPFPPRVGQPTEYSIHWIVRNYSTDVKDVIVRGALKPGVSFVKVEKSSMSTSPQIDNVTGELIWNISKIPATRGAIGAPIEAIIKVKATPTAGDAGQFMNILGESVMRATDEFTGLELSARAGGLSTMLTDDATVGQEGGRVLPQ